MEESRKFIRDERKIGQLKETFSSSLEITIARLRATEVQKILKAFKIKLNAFKI